MALITPSSEAAATRAFLDTADTAVNIVASGPLPYNTVGNPNDAYCAAIALITPAADNAQTTTSTDVAFADNTAKNPANVVADAEANPNPDTDCVTTALITPTAGNAQACTDITLAPPSADTTINPVNAVSEDASKPSRFENIKERIFIPLIIGNAIGYIVDVGSDVVLGGRYFEDGDSSWGTATVSCVLLAYLTNLARATLKWRKCSKHEVYGPITRRRFVAAILNLYPLAILFDSAQKKLTGDFEEAQDLKSVANFVGFIEVLCESTPQLILQLYIVSRTNRMDFLVAFSMLTSLWSVASGICKGVAASMSRGARSTRQIVRTIPVEKWDSNRESQAILGSIRGCEFKFFLIFASWILLHVIAFMPPLSFLASLKNHAHPALLAVNAYLVLHLLFSFATLDLLTYIIEISIIYKLNNFLALESNRKKTAIFSVSLQLLFTIISLWISTAWMTSVAPLVSSSSVAALPNFIWPNPPTGMRGWIVQMNATTEKWMICNETSSSSSTPTDLSNTTMTTTTITRSPPLDDAAIPWYSRNICITSIAPTVYFTSALSSIVLFFYHVALVLFWPRIFEEWQKEWMEKTEAELKANEKWQHKLREWQQKQHSQQ